ncbi:MAG: ATP-grasp domain-containing protein [Candidatus Bathyarchaeota archaeon]|nr:ATP-grasp domain-containing protein [Candidatus Bathyarchaeota archaeon]
MKPVTVLITCAGGVISPSQITSLRSNPDGRKLRIIGTDMTVPCVGQYLTDKFYQVPSGTSPEYVERLSEICSKESVDVLFPASHEEALALTKNVEVFKKIGTTIAVSKPEVLELSFNKKSAFQKLKEKGLPCPEFRVVKNLSEFEDAAAELGIDKRKLVMKPVLTRGGRGARILTKESMSHFLLNQKPGYLETSYDEMIRTLSGFGDADFPELILMEYLPGAIYSVDFLAKDGKALIIVPKVRIVGNPSQTIVGMVKRSALVEETVARISEAFGFDYNVNIEMGCNAEGTPLPFDFNPRIAASVAFCTAAGANLIYFALKMALGEKIPAVEVKDKVMMIRYFKELYISGEAGFNIGSS